MDGWIEGRHSIQEMKKHYKAKVKATVASLPIQTGGAKVFIS
jgi:hypothetical protein